MDDFLSLLLDTTSVFPPPVGADEPPPPMIVAGKNPSSSSSSAMASPSLSSDDHLEESIKLVYKPLIGMEFDSIDASGVFWKKYGYETGFGVRILNSNFGKDKIITSRNYVCCKQGKKGEDKRRVNSKSRADTRCNCGVFMKVALSKETGKYYVKDFVEKHNHDLEGMNTIHNIRAHQKISESQAHEIDVAIRAGLRPKMTHRLMSLQAGGSENLTFTKDRMKSHLHSSKLKNNLALGEATDILEYFHEQSKRNSSFFHAYQLDPEGKIINVFWADPNMLADYEVFGDFVSFDTTFVTNKASRPLGVFSGFNNHRQIVVFGGALLYNETADSFIWLLGVFLNCHRKKLPGIIFTDQDAAMKVAINEVMPTVYHALCIWHIGQNIFRNLNLDIKGDIKIFLVEFNYCAGSILNVSEFVLYWSDMAERYGLTGHHWLEGMYDIKQQFCVAFMKNIFTAGARSTQMSESINANLKKDLGSGLTMQNFFHGFDLFLADVRKKESDSDYFLRQTFPHLTNKYSSILKQGATLYTPNMFKLFNEQFELEYVVYLDKYEAVDFPHEIMVREGDKFDKIHYDPSTMTISCTCCRFEMWGYLCSHILKVFHVCHVDTIPDKYIMKRWTRNAKSNHNDLVNHSSGLTNVQKLDILDSEYRRVAHRVIGYEDEVFEGVRRIIDSAHSYMDKHITSKDKRKETISNSSIEPVTFQNGIVVTGLKKKTIPKRIAKRRMVPWTERGKSVKKLRSVQQKILKATASSKANEEEVYRDEQLIHLTL